MVLGKIQNLRTAVRFLDGLEIPANEVFSFWTHLGRTTRRKGYVTGRELREGCLIPGVGGGLCQLSNALYDAALTAGFEVIERHAHTKTISGSLAELGRDATVFWNYVDLRFRSPYRFRIEARLTDRELVLEYKAFSPQLSISVTTHDYKLPVSQIHSCFSCEQSSCAQFPVSTRTSSKRTAFLVDNYWPEFDSYMQTIRSGNDTLFIPLDGERFSKPNYRWTNKGFRDTKQALLPTALRAYRSRKARNGPARHTNSLESSERLAAYYASHLSFEHSHLVVMQSLLPYLWRDGHLQGRTFDALMTGLPLRELQQRLDQAQQTHLESKTLGDFRTTTSLLDYEYQALQHARQLITPHTEVASLYQDKTVLLEWFVRSEPRVKHTKRDRLAVVFPSATLGRKGAYELRTVLKVFPGDLTLTGPVLESRDFWQGFSVTTCNDDSWLDFADVVVLPSWVESAPRKALQAVGAGIPVIASSACGLEQVVGVKSIPTGDVDALRLAIEETVRATSQRSESENRNLELSIDDSQF